VGGLSGLMARADANAQVIYDWVEKTPWVHNLAVEADTRSNTSVCLTLEGDEFLPKKMAKLLEVEGVAFDIGAYRDAPPGLRIWCGATVETKDVAALLPWIEWAHAEISAQVMKEAQS
jgi:phosphoserine aminotransferase